MQGTLSLNSLNNVNGGVIAGVDEAGRGPLAGPVIAAAVILNEQYPIDGLVDSKLLSVTKREALYEIIIQHCVAFAVARAEVEEIDSLNIHHASLLAMQRVIFALPVSPAHVLVDGKFCPQLPYTATAIIKGDQIVPAISAASIVAKVTRDREMVAYDRQYPGYGFAAHKGYATRKHLQALDRLGVCPLHRRSYAPVSDVISQRLHSCVNPSKGF